MTEEREDVRVPQSDIPPTAALPRLFSDAPVSAVAGAFGGGDGVGGADDGAAGERPRHGGARHPDPEEGDPLSGLLDRTSRGVRGASPAMRDELAELILRYRDEQASRNARRRLPETARPRFSAEQRLLILDSWLRSKLPAGDFAPLVGISLHTLRSRKARFAEFGAAGLDDKPTGRPTGYHGHRPPSGALCPPNPLGIARPTPGECEKCRELYLWYNQCNPRKV